jgi:hypothetical protein
MLFMLRLWESSLLLSVLLRRIGLNYGYKVILSLPFKNTSIIPWQLKNRWSNCMLNIRDMQDILSHVFREGNFVADKLVNIGRSVNEFTWWNSAPSSIRADLARNRDGLPYFRFC